MGSVLAAGFASARGQIESLLPPADPFGEWRGHYLCAQGLTGLTLTIQEDADTNVVALFDFYPLSDNPTQSGQFTMVGDWQNGAPGLSLEPEAWLSRPEGWNMVGLDLKLSSNFDMITGIVTQDHCGPVFLERQGLSLDNY